MQRSSLDRCTLHWLMELPCQHLGEEAAAMWQDVSVVSKIATLLPSGWTPPVTRLSCVFCFFTGLVPGHDQGAETEPSGAPTATTGPTRRRKAWSFTSWDTVGSPERRGSSPAQPVTKSLWLQGCWRCTLEDFTLTAQPWEVREVMIKRMLTTGVKRMQRYPPETRGERLQPGKVLQVLEKFRENSWGTMKREPVCQGAHAATAIVVLEQWGWRPMAIVVCEAVRRALCRSLMGWRWTHRRRSVRLQGCQQGG